MQAIFYVFLGGGLGSLCRYGINRLILSHNWHFPTATFIANVISCIILGFFIGMTLKDGLNQSQRLLWMTGFCGGFSTFSTFSGETFQLLQNGHATTALVYVFCSLLVCILCIGLGIFLGQKFI